MALGVWDCVRDWRSGKKELMLAPWSLCVRWRVLPKCPEPLCWPRASWLLPKLVYPAAVCNVQDTVSYFNIKVCGTPTPRFGPDQSLLVTLTSPTADRHRILSSSHSSPSGGIIHSRCSDTPRAALRLALCPSTQHSCCGLIPSLAFHFCYGSRLLISVPQGHADVGPQAMAEMGEELDLKFLSPGQLRALDVPCS